MVEIETLLVCLLFYKPCKHVIARFSFFYLDLNLLFPIKVYRGLKEAEDFLSQTFVYLKQWFNGDAKEQFRMDFLKCSQVYGYKSIAEVEEEELAEKLVEHDKDIARNMLADGDSVEKVARITKLSEEAVRELQTGILK